MEITAINDELFNSNEEENHLDFLHVRLRLLESINHERELSNLKPLELDIEVCDIADEHCREMSEKVYCDDISDASIERYCRYGLIHHVKEIKFGADSLENAPFPMDSDGIVKQVLSQVDQKREALNKLSLNQNDTNVGIGFTYSELTFRVAIAFYGIYAHFDRSCLKTITPQIVITGQMYTESFAPYACIIRKHSSSHSQASKDILITIYQWEIEFQDGFFSFPLNLNKNEEGEGRGEYHLEFYVYNTSYDIQNEIKEKSINLESDQCCYAADLLLLYDSNLEEKHDDENVYEQEKDQEKIIFLSKEEDCLMICDIQLRSLDTEDILFIKGYNQIKIPKELELRLYIKKESKLMHRKNEQLPVVDIKIINNLEEVPSDYEVLPQNLYNPSNKLVKEGKFICFKKASLTSTTSALTDICIYKDNEKIYDPSLNLNSTLVPFITENGIKLVLEYVFTSIESISCNEETVEYNESESLINDNLMESNPSYALDINGTIDVINEEESSPTVISIEPNSERNEFDRNTNDIEQSKDEKNNIEETSKEIRNDNSIENIRRDYEKDYKFDIENDNEETIREEEESKAESQQEETHKSLEIHILEETEKREKLNQTNGFLQKKLFQLFQKKNPSIEHRDEKVRPIENEKRYQESLLAVHECRIQIQKTKIQNEQAILDLQNCLDNKEFQASEMKSSLVEFKRQLAKNSENSRTRKGIPQHIITQFEEAEAKKEQEIQKIRLKTITLQMQLKKLEQELRAKDQLAEGLHLIDFEQLKIENQTLNEKIEERNEELHKLRKKTTNTVQVLTHIKEKLQFVQAAGQALKKEKESLDVELSIERDKLTKAKKDRDELRTKNQAIKHEQILVNCQPLVHDFEKRKNDLETLKVSLAELKQHHIYLQERAKQLDKNIGQFKKKR